MADNPDTPNNNALTALVSSFTEEQRALYDQASAAAPRAPAAPTPAPGAPTPGTAQRTYSLEEIASFGRALGLGTPAAPAVSAAPAPPAGPPVTSRGAPPPAGVPTDDVPIMSMSESDRKALIGKIGEVPYANRLLKEMSRDRVRIRTGRIV